MNFLAEASGSVLAAREIKTKGRRGRGPHPRNQSRGGPREQEYCSMLPSGGEKVCLRGSGGRNYLGGAWEGPFGDGSSEITCFFWSQPHGHWAEDLEPLCHLSLHLSCSLCRPSFCSPPSKGGIVGCPNVFLKYKEDHTK